MIDRFLFKIRAFIFCLVIGLSRYTPKDLSAANYGIV
jgi:hypothetical protein